MKVTVTFNEKSSISNLIHIEGLGYCSLNLYELPFKIAKNSFSSNTFFKKDEIVKIKYLTLYINNKKYYTPINGKFELTALNDTISKIEKIQYVGQITTHSTEFNFDVAKIKSELFTYNSMTPFESDFFDYYNEGGIIDNQYEYKDITDMSCEMNNKNL